MCESNLISTSAELKRSSERNEDLRKRLKATKDEVSSLTGQLSLKSRQHTEMKEHLAAAQDAFQRMAKNLRAAKEREEEVLRRQSQAELIMEQFRRQKIELESFTAACTSRTRTSHNSPAARPWPCRPRTRQARKRRPPRPRCARHW